MQKKFFVFFYGKLWNILSQKKNATNKIWTLKKKNKSDMSSHLNIKMYIQEYIKTWFKATSSTKGNN